MGAYKGHSKRSKMLMMALLSIVCLTGCHGGIGWGRIHTPIGCQNKGGLDPSRQVDLGHEDACQPAEHDA